MVKKSNPQRVFWQICCATLLVAILAAACGGTGNPKATPLPPLINTPVPLAPILLETDPPESSRLGPDSSFTFSFDQPMNRAAVEGALQLTPAYSGRFIWLDDSTVRFRPDTSLPPGQEIVVRITTQAQSASGMALARPVELTFRTAEPLIAVDRIPAPGASEVDPSSAVVVTFNQPVVALGTQPGQGPLAFTLVPDVPGRIEWINTSTFAFFPDKALVGGQSYQVRLNPDLKTAEGVRLQNDLLDSWRFFTAVPTVVSVSPSVSERLGRDEPLSITFNQALGREKAEAALSLRKTNGAAVPVEINWDAGGKTATLRPRQLLEYQTGYRVAFTPESGSGSKPFQVDYVTVSRPQYLGADLDQQGTFSTYDNTGTVVVKFTTPMKGGDFTRLVQVNPPVKNLEASIYPGNTQLIISGDFTANTAYEFTILAGLTDQWGTPLNEPYRFRAASQPERPRFLLAQPWSNPAGLFFTPQETTLPARSAGVSRITIKRSRLDLEAYVNLSQIYSAADRRQYPLPESVIWDFSVPGDLTRLQTVEIPLSPDNTPLTPGLYYLDVSTTTPMREYDRPQPVLLVVSRVAMTLKISETRAVVWLKDLDSEKALGGRKVSFYDFYFRPVGECTTDSNGVCELVYAQPRAPGDQQIIAVTGEPGSQDFGMTGNNWNAGIAPWEYGVPTSYDAESLLTYLYTDRPIYRPGQTVYFRGILRSKQDMRYGDAGVDRVRVVALSPVTTPGQTPPPTADMTLDVSSYGTFHGAFQLDKDAPVGTYQLKLEGGTPASIFFDVQEYRKPEVDLRLSAAENQALGDKLQAEVLADYFFGAPASGLSVDWSLTTRRGYFDLPGYQTGTLDSRWLYPYWYYGPVDYGMQVASGSGVTDGQGRFTIQVDPEAYRAYDFQDLQEMEVEAIITDAGGNRVSSRTTVLKHPANYYIGIRPESWSGKSQAPLGFSIQTVDWEKEPDGGKALTARFDRVVYRYEYSENGYDLKVRKDLIPASSVDFTTDAEGRARLEFTPPSAGIYQLEVSGGTALSQVQVWVSGEGGALWPELPNQRLEIKTDAKQYQPGDTARLFIPNPFSSGASALITVERGEILSRQVLRINGASAEVPLPISESWAPNVYVSVMLVGKDEKGQPGFRLGYYSLDVDAAAQFLKVELASQPQRAEPGGQVVFNLRVSDAQGKPVQGEFSLAAVDKAVLALKDWNVETIYDFFYGKQPLGVFTSQSLSLYQRRLQSVGGRGGGGAGDAGLQNPLREKFEDTAYWNAQIETDAAGIARVQVNLPDNTTTWVVLARGLDSSTRVGEGELELVVTKDLLIRPVVPRFAVAGDRIRLGAVVHNNTSRDVQAEVKLEANGFTLEDPRSARQNVNIPAGSSTLVTWWGRVDQAEALDLIFSAQAGKLSDRTRPQAGAIPIQKYVVPATFGTGGLLADEGERLEVVGLPRSYTPVGGDLVIELSTSLGAAVVRGLKAMEAYRFDFTEAVLSRLLVNLEVSSLRRDFNLSAVNLPADLDAQIRDALGRIQRLQNTDGGWSWWSDGDSDPYLSAYVLWGLLRAQQAGYEINPEIRPRAVGYITTATAPVDMFSPGWEADRLAFALFTVGEGGEEWIPPQNLYEQRALLSPWGKAMLALALDRLGGYEEQVRTLLSDLESTAVRSATGVRWQEENPDWQNFGTQAYTTAVVVYALARLDPTSPLLPDALRYLASIRNALGGWNSSYDTAWVLLAMGQAMRALGDMQSNYAYSVRVNETELISGQAQPAEAAAVALTRLPVASLDSRRGNLVRISRGAGSGRLYYRLYLELERPAESASAVSRGISITRRYQLEGVDCRKTECPSLEKITMGEKPDVILVQLTLTVSADSHYLMVRDRIPAGTEIVNTQLKTSQQNFDPLIPPYDPANPFARDYGWWYFKDSRVYDDRIEWIAEYLPAGTYQLTYRLQPLLPGEYQIMPARAWEYYFPDVEGASGGGTLVIEAAGN